MSVRDEKQALWRNGLRRTLRESHAVRCLECGRCTAVCPVAAAGDTFSPRRTISRLLVDTADVGPGDASLWSCLTCGLCAIVCPTAVDYGALMKGIRAGLVEQGVEPPYAHGGALQAIMQVMQAPDLVQKRLTWLPPDAEVSAERGDVLYFVGCLPYQDAFFDYLDSGAIAIARQSVRLLNALGIRPVVLADERCCGHDLLWTGDVAGFRRLNAINLELIRATGARTIVTACAECRHVLADELPRHLAATGAEVLHLAEFLHRELPRLRELLQSGTESVVMTYHDPCRLGRGAGVYDEPRALLDALDNVELREMPRNRRLASCCGTSAWSRCGGCSRRIQGERLDEARQTGATVLVTTCPKCRIHFRCVTRETGYPAESRIEVRDLVEVLAERVGEINGKQMVEAAAAESGTRPRTE